MKTYLLAAGLAFSSANRGYAPCGRSNTCVAFDLATLQLVGAPIGTGPKPNALRYDSSRSRVFLFSNNGGKSTSCTPLPVPWRAPPSWAATRSWGDRHAGKQIAVLPIGKGAAGARPYPLDNPRLIIVPGTFRVLEDGRWGNNYSKVALFPNSLPSSSSCLSYSPTHLPHEPLAC